MGRTTLVIADTGKQDKIFLIDHSVALNVPWTFNLPVKEKPATKQFTITFTRMDTSCRHVEIRTLVFAEQDRTLPVDMFGTDVLKTLYCQSKTSFTMVPVQAEISAQGESLGVVRFCLYDPEKQSDFPRCEVKSIGGANVPVINGRPEGSLASYYGSYVKENNDRNLKKSISDFSDAGIRMFEIKIHDVFPYWKKDEPFDEEELYRHIERQVVDIVFSSPQSYYTICWYLYVPPWWLETYPEEVIRLDDGSGYLLNTPGHKLQASYASKHWRDQMGRFLNQTILRLKHSPLADRLGGVQVGYGNCGEWNNWGYHEEKFPDCSLAMQKAFGQWLKDKYKSETCLKTAWGDDSAALDGDVVPTREQRMGDSIGVFRCMPAAQRVVDFYAFWQDYTVQTIEYFAKIAKEATDRRCLVGSYYGYYIGHYGQSPYHCQDSGHFGLKQFLASPWLDFAAGPYPYTDRRRNCAINGVFSSFRLSKKFWYSENDQRTHHSGEDNIRYGTTDTLEESIAVARRDFMINLTKGSSYYFYDFLRGWYQDAPFMAAVNRLKEIDKFALQEGRQSLAQVALFVSETSIPFLSNQCKPATLPFNEMILWEIDAAGAPWDMYLLSDLAKVDLSPYKLVILPNAFAVTPREKEAIRRKLYGSGRTVAFFYAPALITSKGFNIAQATDLTGIQLAIDESDSLTRLTSAIPGFEVSLEYPIPIVPLLYVKDPKVSVLGYINETQQVGFAEKRFKDHTVLYISTPSLNQQWLRKLYDRAGIHVYSRTDNDMFYAAGPFAGLYSRSGGEKKLCWPKKTELIYDLVEKKVLAEKVDSITFSMPDKPATILLYAGPKKTMP